MTAVQPLAIPDLAEQHLGEWQGMERKPFYAERKVGTHTLWFGPADERPPGGESFVDLVERVRPVIERLTVEHRGRDIVAVTHGGTIKVALAVALGLDPQAALSFLIENCSLTRLDYLQPAGRPRPVARRRRQPPALVEGDRARRRRQPDRRRQGLTRAAARIRGAVVPTQAPATPQLKSRQWTWAVVVPHDKSATS